MPRCFLAKKNSVGAMIYEPATSRRYGKVPVSKRANDVSFPFFFYFCNMPLRVSTLLHVIRYIDGVCILRRDEHLWNHRYTCTWNTIEIKKRRREKSRCYKINDSAPRTDGNYRHSEPACPSITKSKIIIACLLITKQKYYKFLVFRALSLRVGTIKA